MVIFTKARTEFRKWHTTAIPEGSAALRAAWGRRSLRSLVSWLGEVPLNRGVCPPSQNELRGQGSRPTRSRRSQQPRHPVPILPPAGPPAVTASDQGGHLSPEAQLGLLYTPSA